MTHYNYRSLVAETTSPVGASPRWAYTACSGLQGVYAITTGTSRLLQGRIPYINRTFVRGLRTEVAVRVFGSVSA
jgi:hypothetical protein